MLIERNTLRPMFKYLVADVDRLVGAAVLRVLRFISFLAALAERTNAEWPALRSVRWPAFRVRAHRPLGIAIVAVLGGIAGFYIAGYTGVLLAVTNRPIWSDTPLLGHAVRRLGRIDVGGADDAAGASIRLDGCPALASLHRMDDWMIALGAAGADRA